MQFFFFHYPNKLLFLYSLLCRPHSRVIIIILFEYFYNKDPHTNSSLSLHPFIIIDPSPGKSYFREVDCAFDIADQGRFIVIFQLTLVRGQKHYRPITRGLLTSGIDPSDSIAIQIGQMYTDMKQKFQSDLSNEMDNLKELEKQMHIQGKYF